MLVVRLSNPTEEDISRVAAVACEHGELVRQVQLASEGYVLFRREGSDGEFLSRFVQLPKVAATLSLDTPFILSSRSITPWRSRVRIRPDLVIGGEEFVVIAGPCAVEGEDQVCTTAKFVRKSGARILRGGAYKPRTSTFDFQGHGQAGLEMLRKAGKQAGLPVISEVMAPHYLEKVAPMVDILQVGMRNALNYPLLNAIGAHPSHPPVLLKRGIGSTLEELLCAADYILAGGNPNVVLCLRGTMDSSRHSRAAMNLADIPALRRLTHLPIIVDPSHAAGRRDLVPAMSAAALVAGADGLLVEVHNQPEKALVDGPQSLTPSGFDRMMHRLRELAAAMGRTMSAGFPQGAAKNIHPFRDLDLEEPSAPGIPHPDHADSYGNLQV